MNTAFVVLGGSARLLPVLALGEGLEILKKQLLGKRTGLFWVGSLFSRNDTCHCGAIFCRKTIPSDANALQRPFDCARTERMGNGRG
jgi:hypothetical protein